MFGRLVEVVVSGGPSFTDSIRCRSEKLGSTSVVVGKKSGFATGGCVSIDFELKERKHQFGLVRV